MQKVRYFRVFPLATIFLISITVSGLSWANENPGLISWQMPAKRFADFNVEPKEIANLIGDGQFVVHSKPVDFMSWDSENGQLKKYEGQRVAHMMSVINAPADVVREMVWDVGGQAAYSPLLKNSKNLSTKDNKRIGEFIQIIKVPILTLESPFVFQVEKLPNGDIATVLIDKGDVDSIFQYWEFFKLNDNSTLVVLSGWQDTASASLSYKILLESEPALGKVFPLLTLYERINRFKEEAESKNINGVKIKQATKAYDIRNINSFISDKKGVDLTELKKLNKYGSLMFFQEPRLLHHDGHEVEIIQISALQYLPYKKSLIQPYLSGFEGLPEFNELTYGYDSPELRKEEFGHLKIKAQIGPVSIPVHIYPKIEDYGPDRYVFFTGREAYMYPLFGHIEHIEMAEADGGGTFVGVTIGGVLGEEASFLFKMSRYLPYHNVLIAATYTMLTADGAAPWLESKIQSQLAK